MRIRSSISQNPSTAPSSSPKRPFMGAWCQIHQSTNKSDPTTQTEKRSQPMCFCNPNHAAQTNHPKTNPNLWPPAAPCASGSPGTRPPAAAAAAAQPPGAPAAPSGAIRQPFPEVENTGRLKVTLSFVKLEIVYRIDLIYLFYSFIYLFMYVCTYVFSYLFMYVVI